MVKLPENMPYIKRVQAKGREYLYFDTGQKDAKGKRIYKRLPPRSDTRKFGGTYSGLLAQRTKRQNVRSVATINDLSRLYQKDTKFTSKSQGTQATYLIYIKQIEKLIGNAPVYALARKDVQEIMDRMQDRPGAAAMLLVVLNNILEIAINKEWIEKSPAALVEPPEADEDGDHAPWPEDLLAEALKDPIVGLPVALLYYTGQRIGDVCNMRWDDIQADGTIYVRQQKGQKDLWPSLHADLAAMLAKEPRVAETILYGRGNKPRKKATLRKHLQDWAAERGHEVVPHGLRKNAVETLLEVGCSVGEIASITGQSLQIVEHYARRFNRRRLGKSAMSKWDGTERQPRKPLENS